VPRPWIFHPGKSTRLKLIRSAPQKGVEEKMRKNVFFTLQTPFGAREHRELFAERPKAGVRDDDRRPLGHGALSDERRAIKLAKRSAF
jgi:hypothetical protein